MTPSRAVPRSAFTAWELVVVVAMVAVLMALLVPAVQSIRHKAQAKETADKLRAMAVAIHEVDARHRKLPPACGPFGAEKTPLVPGEETLETVGAK